MRRQLLLLPVAALALALAGTAAAEPPKVVVSIKPLHSLVAAAMDSVGEPLLLVKAGADPHTHTMRPSEAQALDSAQLVVWAGAGVETFLEKPVAALAGKARILRLDGERTLKRLKAREGGMWEGEDEHEKAGDKHDHGKKGHAHSHDEIDGHLWLDTENAAAIVRAVVRELSALDKPNAAKYAANGDKTIAALKTLDADLRKDLTPIKGKRFIVSHDSIQYFEKRYGLAAVGSISISPDRPPSAKRLHDIRSRILRDRVVCVFSEPQVPDALVKTVVEGTKARTGTIDTDGGVGVPEGKDAYFTIMRNVAKALTGCLGA